MFCQKSLNNGRVIGLMCRVFANGVGDQGSIHVKSFQRLKKWYLVQPCWTLSIIRYGSRVKWSNPGNGVAPSPIPRYSSYWKGSLRVTLDKGCQLYFTYCTQTHAMAINCWVTSLESFCSSMCSLVPFWFLARYSKWLYTV